jgi:hypothetical protein
MAAAWQAAADLFALLAAAPDDGLPHLPGCHVLQCGMLQGTRAQETAWREQGGKVSEATSLMRL